MIHWKNKLSFTRGGDVVEKPRHFSECPGGDNWTPSNSIIHVVCGYNQCCRECL